MAEPEYDRIEVELRRLLDEALRYVEEAKAKLRYVAENLNMIKVLKEHASKNKEEQPCHR